MRYPASIAFAGCLGLLFVTAGCSSLPAATSGKKPAVFPVKVFGPSYTSPVLDNGQAALVFFRPPSSRKSTPVNVYVDSRYAGSVLPGGYIRTVVCMGDHNIALAGENTLRSIPLNVKTVSLGSMDVQLFELSDNSTGIPGISRQTSMDDPSVIRLQTQTISRLGRSDCRGMVPSELKINDEITLAPASSTLNAAQRDRLNRILTNWQSQLVDIKSVELTAPAATSSDASVRAQVEAIRDYYGQVLPASVRISVTTASTTCTYSATEKCPKLVKILTSGRAR